MTRLCDSRKDVQDIDKVILIVFVEFVRENVFCGNVS